MGAVRGFHVKDIVSGVVVVCFLIVEEGVCVVTEVSVAVDDCVEDDISGGNSVVE